MASTEQFAVQTKKLPLIVVKGDGPSLLGQGWLEDIYLDWREVKKIDAKLKKMHQVKTTENTLQQVLNKYKVVFKEELDGRPIERDTYGGCVSG